MGLEVYLNEPGKVPGIGAEKGRRCSNAISKYTSSFGSTRYVAYVDDEPVSALQVVSYDGKHGTIANVYTIPRARKMGWAALLLKRARQDFKSVSHAREDMLSEEGRRWREKVR